MRRGIENGEPGEKRKQMAKEFSAVCFGGATTVEVDQGRGTGTRVAAQVGKELETTVGWW